MKSIKKEIYLVLVYGIDGQSEVFKAYEDKYMAQEVVKAKQPKSFDPYNFWKVQPVHLVLKEQRET